MKKVLILSCLIMSMVIVGCAKSKSRPVSAEISNQYVLEPFNDVNRESTLDLENLKDVPRVVDLKEIMTPAKDQGNRGTCSFFVTAALIEAAVKKLMKVDINISEEYLINVVKHTAGIYPTEESSTVSANMKGLIEEKAELLLEQDWPYQPSWFAGKNECASYESTDPKAPRICYSHNSPPEDVLDKQFAIDDLNVKWPKIKTTNELIHTLAEKKIPLSLTIPVNKSGWQDDGIIAYTDEMRQECIRGERDCGNHTIIITGYDLDKEVFFFRNSWSSSWGQEGYGTLPFSLVDKHSYFESIVLISLDAPLELPEDYNREISIDTKKLNIISSQNKNDLSVTVDTEASIENLNHYPLLLTTTLVTKKVSAEAPDDENVSRVELSQDELKFNDDFTNVFDEKYISYGGDKALYWKKGDFKLKLESKSMTLPSVKKQLESSDSETYLRTTLFIFTDEGFKRVKRVYHSLDALI